jgi:hypothetical protein
MADKLLYTSFDSVKVRLVNKVQFQSDPEIIQDGELPDVLLAQVIRDAETDVEQDLRSRYAIPFKSIRTGAYEDLPDSTQRALRKVVDKRAVHLVLSTDFGRGSHINSDGYTTASKADYDMEIDRLLGRDKEGEGAKRDRFRFSPPLEDLQLARTNAMADDGFKGMMINTDSGADASSYAADQTNDPSRSYVSRRMPTGAGW